MTAKRSPHHAAVERSRVRRLGDARRARAKQAREDAQWNRNIAMIEAALFYPSPKPGGYALVDPPMTEAQKTSRWAKIWGRK